MEVLLAIPKTEVEEFFQHWQEQCYKCIYSEGANFEED
jgi:hypothetical protein